MTTQPARITARETGRTKKTLLAVFLALLSPAR